MAQRPTDDYDIRLDAREVDGEPFGAIVDALGDLGPEDTLRLINSFEPEPLYDVLYQRGFDYETTAVDDDEYRVDITPQSTDRSEVDATVDVRTIPKPDRHPQVHDTFRGIDPGDAMALVAPHEPRPLRHEFDQAYGGAFTWTVTDREDDTVRVRIEKTTATDEGDGEAAVGSDSVSGLTVTETIDVREYPPKQRHELIFESYEQLAPGEAFVFVNDHDPKPLYHQFEAEQGPEFVWQYRQQDPGEFRVAVGRAAGEDDYGVPF